MIYTVGMFSPGSSVLKVSGDGRVGAFDPSGLPRPEWLAGNHRRGFSASNTPRLSAWLG